MANLIEFLKNLTSKDPLSLEKILVIVSLIGAVYGFIGFVGKVVKGIFKLFNRKRLYHLLKPFFSKIEIRKALENYIPTYRQKEDPTPEKEPGHSHASTDRQKLIPYFIKKVFPEKVEEKYHLVLADSGMGKTTFMVNLFLKYIKKRRKEYHIVLVPLGHPKADEKINAVEDKTNTILLLDAFDEDTQAAKDFKERMDTIIDITLDFQNVIITSRTQFFPSDKDIPDIDGIYKFIGNKGEHRFNRIYISPFNQKEINRYLRRKYPIYLWWKRRRARAIVAKSPDLIVRPMLLANIHDLLKRQSPYEYTFEIYEEMVVQWIQRERVKDKEELRRFSKVIARNMYENQQTRGGLFINHDQVGEFAKEHGIKLEELEMRSQSLLNRNAEGQYKFAHKSILEYLLSLELLRDLAFYYTFNFDNMELTQRFYKNQSHQMVISFLSRLKTGWYEILDKEDDSLTSNIKSVDIRKSNLKVLEVEKIVELDLIYNQITDITPLKELKNITQLYLGLNQITDITPLQELKNITSLDLRSNQITDITPLKELKNITQLYLGHNQITDITPLKELKNITHLYLSDNQITDITPLQELKNIEHLYLRNNQITDITPLKELKNIEFLNLTGNPIKDENYLAELRKRNVHVFF